MALYTACGILVLVAHNAAMRLFDYLFHGINISRIAMIADKLITVQSFIFGAVITFVLSYSCGYLFSRIYNKLSKAR